AGRRKLRERFADGLVGEAERQRAHERAVAVGARHIWPVTFALPMSGLSEAQKTSLAHSAVRAATQKSAWPAAVSAGDVVAWNHRWGNDPSIPSQGALLLEVFGNPFRPPAWQPHWLRGNGGAVPRLAQTIYDERRFGELPVLADALEEAGCT